VGDEVDTVEVMEVTKEVISVDDMLDAGFWVYDFKLILGLGEGGLEGDLC
jgi:hypothetical protein